MQENSKQIVGYQQKHGLPIVKFGDEEQLFVEMPRQSKIVIENSDGSAEEITLRL